MGSIDTRSSYFESGIQVTHNGRVSSFTNPPTPPRVDLRTLKTALKTGAD